MLLMVKEQIADACNGKTIIARVHGNPDLQSLCDALRAFAGTVIEGLA